MNAWMIWLAAASTLLLFAYLVYTLLRAEVDTDRSLTLEAIIVILIVTEIVLAFVRP